MDPEGTFNGDTLTVWWNRVKTASKYSVIVEQCNGGGNDGNNCHEVIDTTVVNDTRLVSTSSEHFGPCTSYTLKVMAENTHGQIIIKETNMLSKGQDECDEAVQVALTVTLVILALIVLALVIAIVYYFKRNPVQRLQRARSRVYSKLYSRDRYVRPYLKATYLTELESSLNDFDFEEEFADLEQLAVDTIQRRLSYSNLPVNRCRNRYQDIVPFAANRVVLERPVCLEDMTEASDYINASYMSSFTGSSSAAAQSARPWCVLKATLY
jgi:hypothetical protein